MLEDQAILLHGMRFANKSTSFYFGTSDPKWIRSHPPSPASSIAAQSIFATHSNRQQLLPGLAFVGSATANTCSFA
jgi:hypothetical protein